MSDEWLVSEKNISRIRDPAPPVTFELRCCRAVLWKTVCRRDSGTRAYRDDFTACLPEDGPAALSIKDSFGTARKYFTYSLLSPQSSSLFF